MTHWIVTDPTGAKYNVEEDDGHLFGAERVNTQIQQEIKKGRVGRIYGWNVEMLEEQE